MTQTSKQLNAMRERRIRRVRAKISGTSSRPRFAVFRSNRGMYVQLIDDEKGITLASVSFKELLPNDLKKTKTDQAAFIGKKIAEKAQSIGITKALFDRRGYKYHGRVKILKEATEAAGLSF